MGLFQGVNGAGSCSMCAVGTSLNATVGSAFITCPTYTDSLPGSDAISDCIYNIGYEGSDGAACGGCLAGSYKEVKGSGSSTECAAGTCLNVTAVEPRCE
eukprot:2789411-Rhodomonas_salina.1